MIIDQQTANDTAALFKALSDPTRVRLIAGLLEAEVSVGELASLAEISASAASHQLSVLRQMRLVRTRRDGRVMYYHLDDEHVAELFQKGVSHARHA